MTRDELLAMPAEAYMSEAQLAYFRERLLEMRDEILADIEGARDGLLDNERTPDELDRAAMEEPRLLSMRVQEREGRLLRKIDQALDRIQTGEYGYCEVSGEPIGLPRLLARPTATLCIEVKERQEKTEHVIVR
ncbi:transcriptional regulator, TraR/DksA family [Thioalkalivibrio sp. K90mix]|uniref:RNA polymerase-binding protein DksA n=1 Tax=unclassified Thioalkalivibrio TaxID=2621013 RepID=UPI00019591D7|nr:MULTISPECIES: RNA polymerase-binding protein DksA [unclassified Thioalkalivibrio]ADC72930.1 transcriptional regulator, TraR/DksA family [Thioalkalivibrio sp. K90mix]